MDQSQTKSLEPWLAPLALAAIAALSYGSHFAMGFIRDDFYALDHLLTDPAGDRSWIYARWATGFYRPLLGLFYVFNYKLFGMNALGWRLSGFALWLANVGAVYFLARTISRSRAGAWGAAIVFASCFAGSEVTFWLCAVSDLFAGAIIVAVMALYFHYRNGGSTRWLWAAVALNLVGLFSKEFILLLGPLFLFAYLVLPREERTNANRRIERTAVGCIVLMNGLYAINFAWGALDARGADHIDFDLLGPHLIANWLDYLFAVAWPYFDLGRFPGAEGWRPEGAGRLAMRLIPLAAVGGVIVYARRRNDPIALILTAWCCLMAVLPSFFEGYRGVNRYAFHLTAPFATLVAYLIAKHWDRSFIPIAAASVIGALAILGFVSRSFSPDVLSDIGQSRRAAAAFRSVAESVPIEDRRRALVLENFPLIYFENAKAETARSFFRAAWRETEVEIVSVNSAVPIAELPPDHLRLTFSDTGDLEPAR